MITYKPLFHMLIERNMTKSQLRKAVGFGTNQLAAMSKNEYIALETVDKICRYMDCRIEDVIAYVPDPPAPSSEKCIK